VYPHTHYTQPNPLNHPQTFFYDEKIEKVQKKMMKHKKKRQNTPSFGFLHITAAGPISIKTTEKSIGLSRIVLLI